MGQLLPRSGFSIVERKWYYQRFSNTA